MGFITSKSNSAYRVFETLKFLMKNPASVSDLITHLEKLDDNINYDKVTYSNSVIYKYLNTLKFSGIKLERHKCKYEVSELPFKVKLGPEENAALILLYEALASVPEQKICETIRGFFYQLKMRNSVHITENDIKNSNLDIKISTPTSEQLKSLKRFEKYCKDSLRLQVKYKSLSGIVKTMVCDPIEAKFENNHVFLSCFINSLNEFIDINANQIIKISQTPQCCTKKYFAATTVFELMDRLVDRYTLRNEEYSIISKKPNVKTVISQKESKEQLYRRLMRYGKYCRVVSSQKDKTEMRDLINRALSNYE